MRKATTLFSILLCFILLAGFSCEDHHVEPRLAKITTKSVTFHDIGFIARITYTLQFSDLGTEKIKEYGFVYLFDDSNTKVPTLADNKLVFPFNPNLSEQIQQKDIAFPGNIQGRAYVIHENGSIVYGESFSAFGI